MENQGISGNRYTCQEQLIIEVESRPILYNKGLPEYKNRNLKSAAWTEIADILELPVAEIQKRWRNLKDTFSTKLRVIKLTPSGSSGGVKPKWIFFDKMSFLIPFVQVNKTESNYSSQSNAEDAEQSAEQSAEESAEQSEQDKSETEENGEFSRSAASKRRLEEKERVHVTNKILKAIDNLQKEDSVPPQPSPPKSSTKLFFESLAAKAELLEEYDQTILEMTCLSAYQSLKFRVNTDEN